MKNGKWPNVPSDAKAVAHVFSDLPAHLNSKKIPAVYRSSADKANVKRLEVAKQALVGFTYLATSLVLGYFSILNGWKLLNSKTNIEPPHLLTKTGVALTPSDNLRIKLGLQPYGRELLFEIDRVGNPASAISAEFFDDFAKQIEGFEEVCETPVTILTEDVFLVHTGYESKQVNTHTDPPSVQKAIGVTDMPDIKEETGRLMAMQVVCRLMYTQVPREALPERIFLTERISRSLKADPDNITFGVLPSGVYDPRSNSIFLHRTQNTPTVFAHELTHTVDHKLTSNTNGSNNRQILGDEIFQIWLSEGLPGQDNLSPDLERRLKEIGLRPYALHNSESVEKLRTVQAEIRQANVQLQQLIRDEARVKTRVEQIKTELELVKVNNQNQGFKNLSKQLAELEKEHKDIGVKIDGVKNELKLQEELLKLALDSVIFSPETIAVAMESILELDDVNFNQPKVRAMIDRLMDLMFNMTKNSTFDRSNRWFWISLARRSVRLVQEGKAVEANRLIDLEGVRFGIEPLPEEQYALLKKY